MKKESVELYTVAGCIEKFYTARHKGLEYRVMIALPKDPPPEQGYPVIYALDGDAVFNTLAETVRLQTRKPKGYGPALVVAIGYPSREPFEMSRRCYDYTLPALQENLPQRPNGQPWPDNGGADYFLDFIERELMPDIAGCYPVDASNQTIFGHSLGGLFVLHALFTRPRLFRQYIAGSPSIWWNNRAVLQEQEGFAERMRLLPDKPRLLMTVGGDEHEHMVGDATKLAESLRPLAAEGFDAVFINFPEEGHVSVLPATISRLVRFVLGAVKNKAE